MREEQQEKQDAMIQVYTVYEVDESDEWNAVVMCDDIEDAVTHLVHLAASAEPGAFIAIGVDMINEAEFDELAEFQGHTIH